MRAVAAALTPFYIGNSLRNPFRIGDYYDATVDIRSTASSSYCTIGVQVYFSSPEKLATMEVDWGDGTSVKNPVSSFFEHKYARPGKYNVVVAADKSVDFAVLCNTRYTTDDPTEPNTPRFEINVLNRASTICAGRFDRCSNLRVLSLEELEAERFDGLRYVCYHCESLERAVISGDLTYTVSPTTSQYYGFGWCSRLKEVYFDHATAYSGSNFVYTFNDCKALELIDNNDSDEVLARITAGARAFRNTAIRCMPTRSPGKIGASAFEGCWRIADLSVTGSEIGSLAFSGTGIGPERAYEAIVSEAGTVAADSFDRHGDYEIPYVVGFSGAWTDKKPLALVHTFLVRKVKCTYPSGPGVTYNFSSAFKNFSALVEEVEFSCPDDTKYCRSLSFASATYPATALRRVVMDAMCYATTTAINANCPSLEEVTFARLTMDGVRNIQQTATNTAKNFPFKAPENLVFHCTDGDIRCIGGVWTNVPR